MSAFVGTSKVSSVWVGTHKVSSVWVGTHKVWSGIPEGYVRIGANLYRTTEIGDQVWTATNLKEPVGNCYWYNNDPSYADTDYGMLYPWASLCSASEVMTEALASILPDGWRLPTEQDWLNLCSNIGIATGTNNPHKVLKSVDWPSAGGTDEYGFCALPAGRRSGAGVYSTIGSLSMMWTSTEYSASNAYDIVLRTNGQFATAYHNAKTDAFSVRLVKYWI